MKIGEDVYIYYACLLAGYVCKLTTHIYNYIYMYVYDIEVMNILVCVRYGFWANDCNYRYNYKNCYPSTSAHLDDLMRHQQHAVSWIKQVEVPWAWPLLIPSCSYYHMKYQWWVIPTCYIMLVDPNMLYLLFPICIFFYREHISLKKPLNFVPLVEIQHHGGCQSGNGHHQCGRRENNRGEHCSKIPVGCWYNQWTPCRLICKKYAKNEI